MASLEIDQDNGELPPRFIDPATFDPDDPERQKELMKPAEVREDARSMDVKKRVTEILNSQAFQEEIEEIVESQLRSGPHPSSLIALQQISQMALSGSSAASSALPNTSNSFSGPVIPIADVRGVNTSTYSKGESMLRCKLASVYRMADREGWSSGIRNHITARVPQEPDQLLINPFGLLYKEITAGSLVKIDMQGNTVDRGNTALGVNKAGSVLHTSIYLARPDVKCVIHIQNKLTVGVSAMKKGLLPLTQESSILGNISYLDCYGTPVGEDQMELVARNLGPVNNVMFLRNKGAVLCGPSIEHTWSLAVLVMAACEHQIKMLPFGIDNLVFPSDESVASAFENGSSNVVSMNSVKIWGFGEFEFEAEMRKLDNAGYRTGYVYKSPML